jgi:probable rRNA maturation factor
MITVQVVNAHGSRRIPRRLLAEAVRSALLAERMRHAVISVIGVDNRRCRRLNRTFLGHDYVTDVISFPLEDAPRLEGEIYINLDRARVQAGEYRVSTRHELARLAIHGTLHLTGYDDRTRAAAESMHAREDVVLARLSRRRAITGAP